MVDQFMLLVTSDQQCIEEKVIMAEAMLHLKTESYGISLAWNKWIQMYFADTSTSSS